MIFYSLVYFFIFIYLFFLILGSGLDVPPYELVHGLLKRDSLLRGRVPLIGVAQPSLPHFSLLYRFTFHHLTPAVSLQVFDGWHKSTENVLGRVMADLVCSGTTILEIELN